MHLGAEALEALAKLATDGAATEDKKGLGLAGKIPNSVGSVVRNCV